MRHNTEFAAAVRRWTAWCAAVVCAAVVGTTSGEALGQSTGGTSSSGQTAGKAGEKQSGPADYTSKNFLLHTDLPPAEAQELLGKLETMLRLISKYWGRQCSGIIECYVVKDLSVWPAGVLDPSGQQSIQNGAGVTLTTVATQGNRFQAKSVVYAVAEHGVAQHEAVHAYCGQSWGTTGPVWYAEGMAEMGMYWKEGERGLTIDPRVLRYLKESPPKSLIEIVSPDQVTGDSWQNYAWRWVLCHMLSNNPNYSTKFYPLGIGFLTKRDVSFESTYGAVAEEISFEYLFFLEHMDVGFRADLCAWDWKKKFRSLEGAAPVNIYVEAGKGWQATSATLVKGRRYEVAATGLWQTSPDSLRMSAAGAEDGKGKLVGVTFRDFKLSEPFDLGADGVFEAPADGNLYVRCQDAWHEIADNKGRISLRLKAAK